MELFKYAQNEQGFSHEEIRAELEKVWKAEH